MMHTPAHKNPAHPAGQWINREIGPSKQVDEIDVKDYPTAPRERHPNGCDDEWIPGTARSLRREGTKHGTCFAKVLQDRINERSQS